MCWKNGSGEMGWIIMEWEIFPGVRSERKRKSRRRKWQKRSEEQSLFLFFSWNPWIWHPSHGSIWNQPQFPKKTKKKIQKNPLKKSHRFPNPQERLWNGRNLGSLLSWWNPWNHQPAGGIFLFWNDLEFFSPCWKNRHQRDSKTSQEKGIKMGRKKGK